MNVITKVSALIVRLTKKNYSKDNRNIWAILWKQKLWNYTQSDLPTPDQDNVITLANSDEKL